MAIAVDDANTDESRETTDRISPGTLPDGVPGWACSCTFARYCREYRAPGEFPARAPVAA
jgi:hypothetical protein